MKENLEKDFSKAFQSLTAHEKAKDSLLNYTKSGKTPHALLFTGAKSIGKFRAARCFASFLTKEQNIGETFKANPDIHIVSKEDKKDISAEKIRELTSKLKLKPFAAPQVVGIIKDAERMSLAASNSLLKTLEEPGSNIKIILTSSSPSRLLDTIISRVQEVTFSTLLSEDIEKVLCFLLQKNPNKIINNLSNICTDSLELLKLDSFIDPQSLAPTSGEELASHLELLEKELKTLQTKISRLENLSQTEALMLADELARKKDQLPIWQLLIQKSRKDLRQQDKNLQVKAAKLLNSTLRARLWSEERNANASMQLSEVLLGYSL